MKKLSIFCAGIFLLFLMVGLFGPGSAQATHTKFTQPLPLPPVIGLQPDGTSYDTSLELEAKDADIVVPGLANASTNKTRMWTLSRTGLGTLVGDNPPPTIRQKTGVTNTLKFTNNLNDIQGTSPSGTDSSGRFQGLANSTQSGLSGSRTELTIHHHGSHVAPSSDGWACGYYFPTGGGSLNYVFPMKENDAKNTTGNERGTTEWYHNHRVDVTGHTAWKGLSGGMFIIDDPADPQLPKGPRVNTSGGDFATQGGVFAGFRYDVSLLIRDLNFASANIGGVVKANQIPYTFDFDGSTGNHIVVNGTPQPFMNVEPTKYFFRVLVPGNARKYFMRLRRSGSTSNITMVQVMQDSGITGPVNRTEIPIGIAERIGIVIDFSGRAGQTLILQNNQSATGQCVPGNCTTATSEIMQFRVGSTVTQQENINVANITRAFPRAADLTPVAKNRIVSFTREGGHWTLQTLVAGRLGDDRIMDCARTDADPVVNTVEEWSIRNPGNWTHSIHIHDIDQVCVSRNGTTCPASDLFKEVWPLPPDTTFVVRLKPTDFTQIAFDPDSTACNPAGAEQPPNPDNTGECSDVQFADRDGDLTTPTFTPGRHGTANVTGNQAAAEAGGGRYMIHCHVIEHEDLAMMTQWRVKSNPDGTRRDTPCSPAGSCTQ
jgi:FtsP/CotA-like multicopper oxidase with cupredoxin domain